MFYIITCLIFAYLIFCAINLFMYGKIILTKSEFLHSKMNK